jgi:hypothetical protein
MRRPGSFIGLEFVSYIDHGHGSDESKTTTVNGIERQCTASIIHVYALIKNLKLMNPPWSHLRLYQIAQSAREPPTEALSPGPHTA